MKKLSLMLLVGAVALLAWPGLIQACDDLCQVTVPLISEHHQIGAHPLHAGRLRRRTSVGGFQKIEGKVVVHQHRAADRGDAHRALGDPELVDHLGDEAVGDDTAGRPGADDDPALLAIDAIGATAA